VGELPRRRGRLVPLRGRASIRQAIIASEAAEAWIANDEEGLVDLLQEAMAREGKQKLGRLATLPTPRLESLPPAAEAFQSVAWTDDRKHWLPLGELLEVLLAPEPRDFIVGGMVDAIAGQVTLYRGDLTRLVVPLSIFKPSGTGSKIDPTDFEVIDSGHAIRFGAYEAATDAVFYECDPAFRKRARQKFRAEEKSFGASLRRLRVLRGLRQGDFSPLPAKTIARIERGEVAKPHGRTLEQIARRLGVGADEIETY
jgi:hypothetical protein